MQPTLVEQIKNSWQQKKYLGLLKIVTVFFVSHVLTFIANLLAVGALWLSLQQMKQQTKDSQEQGDRLKRISDSLSTRWIGIFPDNMASIVALVKNAKGSSDSLMIMTDATTYGSFTRPSEYEAYRDALLSARRNGVSIELVAYGNASMRETLTKQFGLDKPDGWNRLKDSPQFSNYFNYYPNRKVPKTPDEFLDLMVEVQAKEEERLKDGGIVPQKLTDMDSMPYFCWIRGEAEAVFSFPSFGAKVEEVSFLTTDSKLIGALKDKYSHVADRAESVSSSGTQ